MSRKYVLAAGAAALGAAAMGRRAVRPGQMFVIVDISVPNGRWVDNIIYNSTREADQEAAKLLRKGKRVQVIDAVWFPPAEARLRATGMRGQGRRGRKVLMEMKYGLPARGRSATGSGLVWHTEASQYARRKRHWARVFGQRSGEYVIEPYDSKKGWVLYWVEGHGSLAREGVKRTRPSGYYDTLRTAKYMAQLMAKGHSARGRIV